MMGFPACPACPRGGMPLALPFFGKREHLVEGEILGYCLSPSTATVWLLAEEEDGFRASPLQGKKLNTDFAKEIGPHSPQFPRFHTTSLSPHHQF